jgi:hypothetical protein
MVWRLRLDGAARPSLLVARRRVHSPLNAVPRSLARAAIPFPSSLRARIHVPAPSLYRVEHTLHPGFVRDMRLAR